MKTVFVFFGGCFSRMLMCLGLGMLVGKLNFTLLLLIKIFFNLFFGSSLNSKQIFRKLIEFKASQRSGNDGKE